MSENDEGWVAAAVKVAKATKPIGLSVAEDLQQRLRGVLSERELTRAEQIRAAGDLIALVRNPPAAGAGNED